MNENVENRMPLGCADAGPRDRSNQLRLMWSCLVWAVCFVGAMRLLKSDLLPAGPIPWLVAALPSIAAILPLVAFVRFLREADELQRLIQLQALALAFGGGFFLICGYAAFEQLGAPAAGIDLAAAMPLLYVIGVVAGRWRYR